MIYQSDIPDSARSLSDRMHSLSMMADIPDMGEYAEAWNKLAADFKAVGYTANAERCYKKAGHYYDQYVRKETEATRTATNQPFRTLYCPSEEAWTRHALNVTGDYYVCGCGSQVEYSADGRLSAVVESE